MIIKRFILTLSLSTLFSTATYAEVVKQKHLNFPVSGEGMGKSIHYSFAQGSAQDLKKNFPEIARIDSLGVLKQRESNVVVAKTVFIVNKPIGFFDHENLVNEDLIKKQFSDLKVKKTGPHSFKVEVPAKDKISYEMNVYSDSDDVSTLPHFKVTEAITASRKLDVISLSASSVSFREMSKFTSLAWGGVVVSAYIPLKESKTLIISYYLTSLKNKVDAKSNEKNMVQEFEQAQKAFNNFE